MHFFKKIGLYTTAGLASLCLPAKRHPETVWEHYCFFLFLACIGCPIGLYCTFTQMLQTLTLTLPPAYDGQSYIDLAEGLLCPCFIQHWEGAFAPCVKSQPTKWPAQVLLGFQTQEGE